MLQFLYHPLLDQVELPLLVGNEVPVPLVVLRELQRRRVFETMEHYLSDALTSVQLYRFDIAARERQYEMTLVSSIYDTGHIKCNESTIC